MSNEQIETIRERFDFEGFTNPNIALVAFARTVLAAYVAKGAEPVATAHVSFDQNYGTTDVRIEQHADIPDGAALYLAPLSEVKAEPILARLGSEAAHLSHCYQGEYPGCKYGCDDCPAARQASPQQGAAQSEVKGEAVRRLTVEQSDQIHEDVATTFGSFGDDTDSMIASVIAWTEDALAASAPTVGGVPAGWKLVPVDPTEEMLTAAAHASMQHLLDCINDPARTEELGSEENIRKTHASRYQSMLAAAPSSPAVEEASSAGVVTPTHEEVIAIRESMEANAILIWGPHFAYSSADERVFSQGFRAGWGGREHPRTVARLPFAGDYAAATPAPAPAVPADGEQPVAYDAVCAALVKVEVPTAYRFAILDALGFNKTSPSAAGADEGKDAQDAARYRYIVDHNIILSGAGWPIAPFGRKDCDRYIDAARAGGETL